MAEKADCKPAALQLHWSLAMDPTPAQQLAAIHPLLSQPPHLPHAVDEPRKIDKTTNLPFDWDTWDKNRQIRYLLGWLSRLYYDQSKFPMKLLLKLFRESIPMPMDCSPYE